MNTPWLDLWLQASLCPDETLSAEALLERQMALVRSTLAHAAANSPYYRGRLRDVSIGAIRTPLDMARLPRTGPDDLRAQPDAFLAASQDEVARVISVPTSGTSGPGKRVFYTPGDLERIIRFFGFGMRNMLQPDETALVLLPGERPGSVGVLLGKALDTFGARAVVLSPDQAFGGPLGEPDRAMQTLLGKDVRCIVGAPAHLNALAAHWTAMGRKPGILRSALLCWDAVPDSVVQNVQRAFGCRTFQHWGMVETGLGGAVNCDQGQGLHLREADIFVEIADPDSGAPLADGEWGEITVTTLSRRAMPLIRYRTGDRGCILPGRCQCGSPLRRLDPRIRRLHDKLPLPGGTSMNAALLGERLYAVPGLADFQARLECDTENRADDAPDRLVIEISGPAYGGAAPAMIQAAEDALAALPALAAATKHGLRIEIRATGRSGPLSTGLEKRALRGAANHHPRETT
ncbi:DVU_1553 family AMP-dependent CoA ligase [Paucidesulfovibrio longus]|uniref:DVU_1553 family AMP-dependent CoA ligase n=1 Tax=Paucidesulfovibrio longus TaxID=889 RepID=UPI0003B63C21|nr:AMP-binding protein [Paucidesulfovibrio longus]